MSATSTLPLSTHGTDDERRLQVMLVEALLDNRRQEMPQTLRSSASRSVERDDLRQTSALLLDLDQRFLTLGLAGAGAGQ